MGLGVWVLGFWGLGFGVWCLGFEVWGLGFGVGGQGLGFGVWGSECRVEGANPALSSQYSLVPGDQHLGVAP